MIRLNIASPLMLTPLSERVRAIRVQIANGTYSASGTEIADKMIAAFSQERGVGQSVQNQPPDASPGDSR